MKSILLLVLIFTVLFPKIYAQIEPAEGDIVLTTQAEIDTFSYTEVKGNLFIYEAVPGSITNLEGLKSLTKISPGFSGEHSFDAALIIQYNLALKNLNGLENLTSLKTIYFVGNNFENIDGINGISFAEEVAIVGNNKLTNLNGLSNLDSVSYSLGISYNAVLTDVQGLSGLISAAYVGFHKNPLLKNLNGLSNLKYVSESVNIEENAMLESLDGLLSLTSVGFKGILGSNIGLYITQNPSLKNIDGLSGVTSISGTIKISDNAALTSMKGLSNVSSSLHRLIINNNGMLTNIDGLNKIPFLLGAYYGENYYGGDLEIYDNPVLTNIDGLSGLDSTNGIYIRDNPSLTNINGLSGLKKAGYLSLQNNAVISNVDGLSNLAKVEVAIVIENNPQLFQFCGLYNLFSGGTYFGLIIERNAENPSIEQVILDCSPTDRSFISVMQCRNVLPEVTTELTGGGMFILNNSHDTLRYWISLCNITGSITEAHFHNSYEGADGPAVKNITGSFNGSTAQGLWTTSDSQPLTSALINELFGDNIYVDVHTSSFAGGEIRGQITTKDVALYADLTGDQEVPPVSTNANGSGTFILGGDGKSLQYHVIYENLSSPITSSHFHKAPVGITGSIVKQITFDDNSSTGIWTQTDSQPLLPSIVADLLGCSDLYVNIHSANFPEGEIRGQILKKRSVDEFPYMTFWAVSDEREGKLYYYTLSEVDYFGNVEGNIRGTRIENQPKDVEDLAIDDDGTLYLINNYHTSKLFKINPDQFDKDPDTPVETEYIGDTKLPAGALPDEIASLCFINGVLYGIGKETKILYSISTVNGSVTKVSELDAGEFRTDGLVMGADNVVYLLKTVKHGPSEIWKFNDFPNGDISLVSVVEGSGKLESITAHPNGNIYAADEHNLFEINLSDNTIGILDDYSIDIEGMTFNYRAEMLKPVQPVRKFRIIGKITDVSENNLKPAAYKLDQNFPNPFNPSTKIKYSIPEAAHVKINIYNSLGEVVRTLMNETKPSGFYQVTFEAAGLPSGVYICRLEAGNFIQSYKMILLK